MICMKKIQVVTCAFILTVMIFFPFHLFAQEETGVVEQESGFYYTVQKGDTLWDLSQRFSDSYWLWPDLWQENKQIANPHWIYPGERIRLFHRKGAESFAIKPEKPKELAVVSEQEPLKEPPYYYYSPINRVGFLRKEPVVPRGTIFKVKDNKELIGIGDLVYIKQKNDKDLILGNKYTVYRTFEPITDEKTKNLVGTQHFLTGVVEITKIEPSFALARVVQSYRTIGVNDLLMPYKKRSPKIFLTQSRKGLKGKIIIFESHGNISGDNAIAFIDKGRVNGVKRGQLYSIYYQESQRINPENKEDVVLTPVDYGTFLVLYTEQEASTVLITRSEQSISPQATFQSPPH